MLKTSDTIAAPVTPPGRAGVGIVRISGPLALAIATKIINFTPKARIAHFCDFLSKEQTTIDQGLAIYFQTPHSFTGEDVVELQCHGSVIIMDMLLERALQLGARMAEPGEFTRRAFLNHKIDLTQAEAIADLIDATSQQAAQNAVRSMQGEFSRHVNQLLAMLIKIRAELEATIDFPEEEEIENLALNNITLDINNILQQINNIKNIAKQGEILRDGITIVLAGKPNAGKSSLFNYLAGHNAAIVTDIPGTTRDVLHARIQIDGLPVNLIDTAGLRAQADIIEAEGIRRAQEQMQKADHVLLIVDATNPQDLEQIPENIKYTVVYNKVDLITDPADCAAGRQNEYCIAPQLANNCLYISVQNNQGLDLLKQYLKDISGMRSSENGFSARRRHLEALNQCEQYLINANKILLSGSLELAADDLNFAQRALGEITGEFSADNLLDKIFGEFCIGK